MAANQHVDGHTGRDALIGGIVGHEGHHGHTARDAAIGGMAGHVSKDHKEERMEGTRGPSMGDKISGGMDKMVGKMTNNPDKVAEGQAKTGTL